MAQKDASKSKVWTVEEIHSLIEAFRTTPDLWQRKHANYKNKLRRIQLFADMAADFGTSTDEIKEKFRSLRTVYMQNLKRVATIDGYVPKWEFYNSLHFLHGEITSKYDDGVNIDDDGSESAIYLEEPYESLPSDDTHQPEKQVNSKKRRVEAPPSRPQEQRSPSISNDAFGKFVMHSLDAMNNPLIEEKTKLRIQLLISDAMHEAASAALSLLTSHAPQRASFQSPTIEQDTYETCVQTGEELLEELTIVKQEIG
ncbi:uncharacterized protein LOC131683933 [Topomyia yanbarensis]|uniref:uncharacterized protein LOC131683933 n=1 Tax=Topomyia yanbarensis TaxID=2498891 RepID=UPI00273AACD9|nr:uncharacterized protein LOC131683933 [Topomyia yanbarensis]